MWSLRIALVFMAADIFFLYLIWPDWGALRHGAIPKSVFIENYIQQRQVDRSLPRLRWFPVSRQQIPPHLRRAAVVAEDARFYEHQGVDLIAFREAMNRNLDKMQLRYGGSTISQQTTKNLFLSSSRDPLRKWHELVLTLGMEANFSKQRIMEIYLNIAEFGTGIYGVEAAARHYWGRSASQLTPWQAVELAATLPSPRKHNPQTRTRSFESRVSRIQRWIQLQDAERAGS